MAREQHPITPPGTFNSIEVTRRGVPTCWVTYVSPADGGVQSVHRTELQALRYALDHSEQVAEVPYGVDIATAIREQRRNG